MSRLGVKALGGSPTEGVLSFRGAEHSFLFLRAGNLTGAITTNLLVGTLSIEVDIDNGRLLYVDGLSPRSRWIETKLPTPTAVDGSVELVDRASLESGVAVELASVGKWTTAVDSMSGWICCSEPDRSDDLSNIQIATNTLIGIANEQIKSIWLHPSFE